MAAGKGTRMKSRHPKVLQKLAGRALLQHVLDTAAQLKARSAVVVTGHGAAEVEAAIAAANGADGADGTHGAMDLKFVRQEPQLGTGHAVQQAVPALKDDGLVVVLSGDVPLTQADRSDANEAEPTNTLAPEPQPPQPQIPEAAFPESNAVTLPGPPRVEPTPKQ